MYDKKISKEDHGKYTLFIRRVVAGNSFYFHRRGLSGSAGGVFLASVSCGFFR
jgi:hypothetical protein